MYGLDNNVSSQPDQPLSARSYPKSEIKLNTDADLTIYIQNESPGKNKESEWLPAPKDAFYLILRTHARARELVQQEWVPPAVTKANSE